VGGLVIGRMLDTFGLLALAVYFGLACPVVALIGTPGLPQWALMVLIFLTGFSVLGAQLGLSASVGAIYPTAIRSNGAGWAHALGRVGGISGPMIAAWLLGQHIPLHYLFFVPILPLAIGALAGAGLNRFHPSGHRNSDAVLPPVTET
jgi:AAHS family 4-hydroxybenzoate transporter-like MFS transporter